VLVRKFLFELSAVGLETFLTVVVCAKVIATSLLVCLLCINLVMQRMIGCNSPPI
jgi:hypothetical protein